MTPISQLNEKLNEVIIKCPEITYMGEEVLRQPAEEVELAEALDISEKLQKTLLLYRDITGLGRGLAAPQVGISKRVFVTYSDNVFKTYINPQLVELSKEENLYRELCISCGYVSGDVKRPRSITLEYMDEKGERQTKKADGFLARLLQHEYDHLGGILNLDKAEAGTISFMTSDPTKEELRNI